MKKKIACLVGISIISAGSLALFNNFSATTSSAEAGVCPLESLPLASSIGGLGLAQISTGSLKTQKLAPSVLGGTRDYLWEDDYVARPAGIFSGIYIDYDRLNKYQAPAWPATLPAEGGKLHKTGATRLQKWDPPVCMIGSQWIA
jgi:hypothetical protein